MFHDQIESTVRRLGQMSKTDQDVGHSNLLTGPASRNQFPYELSLLAGPRTSNKSPTLIPAGRPNSPEISSISRVKMDVPCSEQALSLFFHQYVSQGNGETPGFNDFLPLFYQQAHSNSCLKHCVAATAYASLANQSNLWTSAGKHGSFMGQHCPLSTLPWLIQSSL
jgi:hypothetical protein